MSGPKAKRRPFGLGPIPLEPPISPTRQVTVRQGAAVGITFLMAFFMVAFAIGVIAQPGETLNANAFLDRFLFGIIVVPCLYGIDHFLWRPRVIVSEAGVTVHNPVKTAVLSWPEIGGAGFDRSFTIVLARGGDRLGSVLFGPTYSSQLTTRTRVDQLIALVNHEANRRSGRVFDPEAAYEADALVGELGDGTFEIEDAAKKFTMNYGWTSLAVYAALWTVGCAVGAALA
ncbi:MAG: PH domain-containing protein [Sporichthyaceae bacterium]